MNKAIIAPVNQSAQHAEDRWQPAKYERREAKTAYPGFSRVSSCKEEVGQNTRLCEKKAEGVSEPSKDKFFIQQLAELKRTKEAIEVQCNAIQEAIAETEGVIKEKGINFLNRDASVQKIDGESKELRYRSIICIRESRNSYTSLECAIKRWRLLEKVRIAFEDKKLHVGNLDNLLELERVNSSLQEIEKAMTSLAISHNISLLEKDFDIFLSTSYQNRLLAETNAVFIAAAKLQRGGNAKNNRYNSAAQPLRNGAATSAKGASKTPSFEEKKDKRKKELTTLLELIAQEIHRVEELRQNLNGIYKNVTQAEFESQLNTNTAPAQVMVFLLYIDLNEKSNLSYLERLRLTASTLRNIKNIVETYELCALDFNYIDEIIVSIREEIYIWSKECSPAIQLDVELKYKQLVASLPFEESIEELNEQFEMLLTELKQLNVQAQQKS